MTHSPSPSPSASGSNARRLPSRLLATWLMTSVLALGGCAVMRGQESVGAYVDDTAITTAIKARFVDNKDVDASSISVETLNGVVMLSGFAKNARERENAEMLSRKVEGVKSVRNEVVIRP